jgi:hypothetical protein
MDLLNATKMVAGYTMGVEPSAREHLVVVVKGTFDFPKDGGEPKLADEQAPLVYADTFTGEPGFSATVDESDFAFRKPRCDVLLKGTAYAPEGKPATKVTVGLKVGPMIKAFDVVGDRTWDALPGRIVPTAPRPFLAMPISYDRAFGGADTFHEDPGRHSAYMANPVGRGYHRELDVPCVHAMPLPNTEERGRPVSRPDGDYRPMAFGPISRGSQPRLGFAGTYDQNWLDTVFPFLPQDFKEDYYQAAPTDQQIPYLKGGEDVVLLNLTPPDAQTRTQGRFAFRLPKLEMPVVFFLKTYEKEETQGVVDTLVIEPDVRRFTVTWRASRPLKRNMFEVVQVLVGTMPRGWWRARELGKTYYPSLGAMVAAKRREAKELAE